MKKPTLYRLTALGTVLVAALLQTGCVLAPTALGIMSLLGKNDAPITAPVWQQDLSTPPARTSTLPDLNKADPNSSVALAR